MANLEQDLAQSASESESTIFDLILNKSIPADIIYED